MLIAIMLNIIMLIVTYNPFMLSVIILSVTVSKKILNFFTDEMKILSLNFVLRTRR